MHYSGHRRAGPWQLSIWVILMMGLFLFIALKEQSHCGF